MTDSPTREISEQRIGRTLNGKWRLESLLGVGGTAAVYAAVHRNGACVAIKILHPAISASKEARIRFKREGYLVNRVEHPGVVHAIDDDIDETDGSAFIVMDRADGVSLWERMQQRLLDEPETLEVTEQVLDILAAAHAHGVVHRDLKPDNLLIDEAGRVRLLDFGIARLIDDDANLTRTDVTFGTPAYMAPEQALGRKHEICAQTDIYGMGATMLVVLSGEQVHHADNAQELLIKIATLPARSLADVRPDSSPELVELVDCATMMHVEDRWGSAEAMLARVHRVMHDRGLHASRRHISSRISAMVAFDLEKRMPKRRSRPRALVALGVSALLALVAAMLVGAPNPRACAITSTATAAANVTKSIAQAHPPESVATLAIAEIAVFSREIAVATQGIPARSAPSTKPSAIAPRFPPPIGF